jgi:predicted metalloprotease with PDZ domain
MKRILTTSAAAALALAITVPAFAGGDHCGGARSTATTADAKASCANKTTAWAGAWLHRSTSGTMTVAGVAKGSPAARAGLRTGDVVLAVNGYNLSNNEDRALCASKAECNVGSAVTYTVQRGSSTMAVKFKLEKMPANATARFANRQASFDPALAAVVTSGTN